ncbi:MAG: tRNA uracil 4-sulfurtransferase ThiI [Bacillota bacterium]|nr:tRNA uracil 4-sulfurtransferase ThiI [Bacillota bacterium]
MDRQLILIRYGELGLKGKNRHLFIGRLTHNIRYALRDIAGANVYSTWGRIWAEVEAADAGLALARLQQVFGVYSLSPVMRTEPEVPALAEAAQAMLEQGLPVGGSFKIETRRSDKSFPLTSPEISRAVANLLFERIDTTRYDADMHDPDLRIDIEVRGEGAYVYGHTLKGAGGLPVGCGGRALLLLSGGIDSPVAGMLAMKRGVVIEAIHYHSFPFTGEKAKEKVYELCRLLSARMGAPLQLHMVYFTEIQKQIYANCREEYGITLMRRFMYRIAERVAKQRDCLALYTGESVGQVASQTLESIACINDVISIPVMRPLVGMDKEEIMERARAFGSYDISILPYEDCCTVFLPKYPKIKPRREEAEKLERALNIEQLLDEALAKSEILTIDAR